MNLHTAPRRTFGARINSSSSRMKEQKSAKSQISRRNFLFSLENAETAKIFVRSLPKHKRHLKKIFRIHPRFSTLSSSQPFRSRRGKSFKSFVCLTPGQIVGIINSDCRFLTTANFSFITFQLLLSLSCRCCCFWGSVIFIFFWLKIQWNWKCFELYFMMIICRSLYLTPIYTFRR